MALTTVAEIKARITAGQRLMGLDVGSKTIGLALSDVALTIASPLTTIRRTRFATDGAELCRLATVHDVGGLVIGLPISMDGREGPRCQSVRQFARNLEAIAGLPTAFWDERLSTAAVERMLIEQVDMGRKRRGQVVDKLAAAYILQGALDALNRAIP